MTVKDFKELTYICSLYTMCRCLEECISSAAYPEKLKECFEKLEDSLSAAIESMNNYREETKDMFLSACEDYKQ